MQKKYRVTVEGKTFEVTLEEVKAEDSVRPSAQPFAPIHPVTPPTPVEKTPVAPVTPSAAASQPSKTVSAPPVEVNPNEGEDEVAPLQGNIWKVVAQEGDVVAAGDPVLILEAMKMENEIVAPRDGVITKIYVKEGQAVDTGEALYSLQ